MVADIVYRLDHRKPGETILLTKKVLRQNLQSIGLDYSKGGSIVPIGFVVRDYKRKVHAIVKRKRLTDPDFSPGDIIEEVARADTQKKAQIKRGLKKLSKRYGDKTSHGIQRDRPEVVLKVRPNRSHKGDRPVDKPIIYSEPKLADNFVVGTNTWRLGEVVFTFLEEKMREEMAKISGGTGNTAQTEPGMNRHLRTQARNQVRRAEKRKFNKELRHIASVILGCNTLNGVNGECTNQDDQPKNKKVRLENAPEVVHQTIVVENALEPFHKRKTHYLSLAKMYMSRGKFTLDTMMTEFCRPRTLGSFAPPKYFGLFVSVIKATRLLCALGGIIMLIRRGIRSKGVGLLLTAISCYLHLVSRKSITTGIVIQATPIEVPSYDLPECGSGFNPEEMDLLSLELVRNHVQETSSLMRSNLALVELSESSIDYSGVTHLDRQHGVIDVSTYSLAAERVHQPNQSDLVRDKYRRYSNRVDRPFSRYDLSDDHGLDLVLSFKEKEHEVKTGRHPLNCHPVAGAGTSTGILRMISDLKPTNQLQVWLIRFIAMSACATLLASWIGSSVQLGKRGFLALDTFLMGAMDKVLSWVRSIGLRNAWPPSPVM
jgi:hypothetical protein